MRSFMNIIVFFLVGTVAGCVAAKWLWGDLMGDGYGTLSDIIFGITGAIIGGVYSYRFIGPHPSLWESVGIAVLISIVGIMIGRLLSCIRPARIH